MKCKICGMPIKTIKDYYSNETVICFNGHTILTKSERNFLIREKDDLNRKKKWKPIKIKKEKNSLNKKRGK